VLAIVSFYTKINRYLTGGLEYIPFKFEIAIKRKNKNNRESA
jgi:hypothetical protein